MNVRPATTSDVAAIAVLEALLFGPDAWSAALVADELGAGDRCTLVAEENAMVCGYAITMRSGEVMDLLRIGVRAEGQRRGVARTLLDTSLTQAQEAGVQRMLLEVSSTNRPALAFYAATGFVAIDRRVGYYRDGNDAVVMELPLVECCGGRSRGGRSHG